MFQPDNMRSLISELDEALNEMYNRTIELGPLKHGAIDHLLSKLEDQTRSARKGRELDNSLLEKLDYVCNYARRSEANGWVPWNTKMARSIGCRDRLSQEDIAKLQEDGLFHEHLDSLLKSL
jgi:hypothetical protein